MKLYHFGCPIWLFFWLSQNLHPIIVSLSLSVFMCRMVTIVKSEKFHFSTQITTRDTVDLFDCIFSLVLMDCNYNSFSFLKDTPTYEWRKLKKIYLTPLSGHVEYSFLCEKYLVCFQTLYKFNDSSSSWKKFEFPCSIIHV